MIAYGSYPGASHNIHYKHHSEAFDSSPFDEHLKPVHNAQTEIDIDDFLAIRLQKLRDLCSQNPTLGRDSIKT